MLSTFFGCSVAQVGNVMAVLVLDYCCLGEFLVGRMSLEGLSGTIVMLEDADVVRLELILVYVEDFSYLWGHFLSRWGYCMLHYWRWIRGRDRIN